MKKRNYYMLGMLLAAGTLCGCSDDEPAATPGTGTTDPDPLPEWYYAGGELGTAYLSTSNAYEQPTPV